MTTTLLFDTTDVRLTSAIPTSDLDLFSTLPRKPRRLLLRRLKALRRIGDLMQSQRLSLAASAAQVAALFHGERGWNYKSLMALYKEYSETKNWRVLVNASMAGPAWWNQSSPTGLPPAFLVWLAQQWSQNQRDKFLTVHARLITRLERWRAGDDAAAIPGYQAPPEGHGQEDIPPGWTYSNLSIAVKPYASKFARRMVQRGPKSASSLGPQVPSTREGAAVGQYYIFDDSWNDFKVVAFGQSCRLLSFHCLDLLSACNVARGYKPALRDERDVEERLREKEMIWLLVKILTTDGYHPGGCTIICEKGTATVRDREEEILTATMGNTITIKRGPAGGSAGVGALFTGPSGGNPRWKAPLESWFNLLRNHTADMLEFPGQTGSNSRLNQPEGLPGLEKDTMALVKAAKALPPEKAELLRLGLLPQHEAIFKLDAVTEYLNWRTDHALQGWKKCGHYVQEFRLGTPSSGGRTPWLPMAALLDYAPEERAAISAVLKNNPSLQRERALSPREVFDAGKDRLIKLPLSVAALLMDDLPAIEVPVKNCRIDFESQELAAQSGQEELSFGLIRRDGRGISEPLRNGDKYQVRFNPLDPRICWLYDHADKFAGVAPYYGRCTRDPQSAEKSFAAKRQALAPLVTEARQLAANITEAATTRASHNATLFAPEKGQVRADEALAAAIDNA